MMYLFMSELPIESTTLITLACLLSSECDVYKLVGLV